MRPDIFADLHQPGFFGRHELLQWITSEISDYLQCRHHNAQNELQGPILYLIGEGGIGKTSLLQEAKKVVRSEALLLETGVIDLYQGRYHQPVLMMDAIMRRLTRSLETKIGKSEPFTKYQAMVERYYHRNVSLDAVTATFLEEYAALTTHYSVVLFLDTFEKLHPFIAETEPFRFRQPGRLEEWLLDVLVKLPGTLIIIAGRERESQQQRLHICFSSRLSQRSIDRFTTEEVRAYVRSHDPQSSEFVDELAHVSSGRPVVLAIVLAILKSLRRDSIDGSEIVLPPNLIKSYPANRKNLGEYIARLFVQLQLQEPDTARLLEQIVYLRRGVDQNRLVYINEEGSDQGQTQANINRFLTIFYTLSIAKTIDSDAGDQQKLVTLHDEVYDLLFDYLASPREVVTWYKRILTYLSEERKRVELLVATHDDSGSAQQLLMIETESLFYTLAKDPVEGYREYCERIQGAIATREEEYDAQLQDELARFFEPQTSWGDTYRRRVDWPLIVFEESLRWAERRFYSRALGGDRYHAARAILESIQHSSLYKQTPSARRSFERVRLRILSYLIEQDPESRRREIEAEFEELIALLQTEQAGIKGSDDHALATIQRELADVYTDYGYYRRLASRFVAASDYYKRGVDLYRLLGPEAKLNQAITLNNLGFAYSQGGYPERGLEYVQIALNIAESRGLIHQMATIFNTMARIQLDLDNKTSANSYVQRARKIFEEKTQSVRGRALCAYAEGLILTQMAVDQSTDWPACESRLNEVKYRLEEALQLFELEGLTSERTRRIEVHLALAVMYRLWGKLRPRDNAQRQTTHSFAQASQQISVAETLLTNNVPDNIRVSIRLERASLAVEQADYAQAHENLDQAEALIHQLQTIPPPEPIFRLWKSQAHRIRGICAFKERQLEQGCSEILYAFNEALNFPNAGRTLRRIRQEFRRALLGLSDPTTIPPLPTQVLSEQLEDLELQTYRLQQRQGISRAAFAEVEQIFVAVRDDIRLLRDD